VKFPGVKQKSGYGWRLKGLTRGVCLGGEAGIFRRFERCLRGLLAQPGMLPTSIFMAGFPIRGTGTVTMTLRSAQIPAALVAEALPDPDRVIILLKPDGRTSYHPVAQYRERDRPRR
jgi:hypothetical protein